MSGGSFDYACFMVEDETGMLNVISYLKGMEAFCRDNNLHDAADIVKDYEIFMKTHQRQMLVYGRRIAGLLKAIEWTASGDTNTSAIEKEFAAFMEPSTS